MKILSKLYTEKLTYILSSRSVFLFSKINFMSDKKIETLKKWGVKENDVLWPVN